MVKYFFIVGLLATVFLNNSYGQVEVEPWGNITGIRTGGQLMEFETSLALIKDGWSNIISTGREKQRPKYFRDGNKQTVITSIDSLNFTEVVQDSTNNSANILVKVTCNGVVKMEGAYFIISLPLTDYSSAVAITNNAKQPSAKLSDINTDFKLTSDKITLHSLSRSIELAFNEPTSIVIKKDTGKLKKYIQVYIPIIEGDAQNSTIAEKRFTIKASGLIDKKPVNITLNTSGTGRAFDGFGGNFRLQNPRADPQVIDYCLQNLRVAWSRIEMPWRFWQPIEDSNPTDSANAGKLHPNVQKAMEMAQRLNKMNIPIILSAWFPPRWAIVGEPNFRHTDGVWGNPLDSTKANKIYKSITDYILYLKNIYGVEVALFSFNESDLGINIRQTGQEHATLIKGLGSYFVSHGLKTKMLLGDNSDATTYEFIYPAMRDAEAKKYIGAISFHSWRGWEKETLEKWADAAKKLNVPLIVAEGSIDAAAWNYPAVFQEQTYALQEINLYIRLLSICQPLSILQWQLTSDYSPLAGGGIFGNNEPLHPTQRFWNLKQLASTPEHVHAMSVVCNAPYVTCAALGNNAMGVYAIHIVNNGAARQVNLSGLPLKIKSIHVFVTDKTREMKEDSVLTVSHGHANFKMDSESFYSLIAR